LKNTLLQLPEPSPRDARAALAWRFPSRH
jgi:hypothetical protein